MNRRIRMKQNACGPAGNFLIGQEFGVPGTLSTAIADEFVEKDIAEEVGDIPAPTEDAPPAGKPETASTGPAETAEAQKPERKTAAAKPTSGKGRGKGKTAPKTEG